MKKERNAYIDIVKAITIILVVFGHCIQYGSGEAFLSSEAYFDNKVFILIYSFHMPLFMLISGYLFAFTVNKQFSNNDVKTIIVKKVKQLIIPLLSWSVVSVTIRIGELVLKGNVSQISVIWFLNQLVSDFVLGPWFLWAIWWCSLIVIFVRYFFNDNPYIYFAVLILTFFVPDSFGLALYKFMYPFFVLGYWFNTYNFKEKLKKVYSNKIFAIVVIVSFFILLRLYNRNKYIYTTGYTLLGKDLFEQL